MKSSFLQSARYCDGYVQEGTMSPKKLSGKVAIITGAGMGIGRSIALAFAEEEASVVLVSRHQSDIDSVANEATALGANALAIRADVSQESEVTEMVNKTLSQFHRIDVLVNNAAVSGLRGLITEIKTEDWDRMMSINVRGMFLCSKAVVPVMIKQREGNIINLSSGAGILTKDDSFLSTRNSLPYCVSKFAVEGFTLVLAAQLNRFNINVNALRPGPSDTRAHASAPPELKAQLRKPDQVKAVALFLATQGPAGITGESILAASWDQIYPNRSAG